MMDLDDEALLARARIVIRDCDHVAEPESWTSGSDGACSTCLQAAFIALRDAARAEMNIVKNRAIAHLIECGDAARADLAVPCQRHGCMWDAPEAHETCRAEQREADAKIAEWMHSQVFQHLPECPDVYKRLWFSSADHDHEEKLTRYAQIGWFLCAVEPGAGGAYFWLRQFPSTDNVRTP